MDDVGVSFVRPMLFNHRSPDYLHFSCVQSLLQRKISCRIRDPATKASETDYYVPKDLESQVVLFRGNIRSD